MVQHKCPECGRETDAIYVSRSEQKVKAYKCDFCKKTWVIELLDES